MLLRTLRALLPACTTIAGCVATGIIGKNPASPKSVNGGDC